MAAANFTASYQPTRVTNQAPVLTEHGSRVELIKSGFCPECGFQLRKKNIFGRWKTLHEVCPRESSHPSIQSTQTPTAATPTHAAAAVNQNVPPKATPPQTPPAAAMTHSAPSHPPSGGACTAAFLRAGETCPSGIQTWGNLLQSMQAELRRMGIQNRMPVLTSSTVLEPTTQMQIVPPTHYGMRRAILIGISYAGQRDVLRGSHEDVDGMKRYLRDFHGFEEKEMLILLDDGVHHPPTRQKMKDAFAAMVNYSKKGDVVFVYYSGRGLGTGDGKGSLVPQDCNSAGWLLEDVILKTLLKPMQKGVHTTLLFDCHNSGMVLGLPFRLSAGDGKARAQTAQKGVVGSCVCLGLSN